MSLDIVVVVILLRRTNAINNRDWELIILQCVGHGRRSFYGFDRTFFMGVFILYPLFARAPSRHIHEATVHHRKSLISISRTIFCESLSHSLLSFYTHGTYVRPIQIHRIWLFQKIYRIFATFTNITSSQLFIVPPK